MFNSTTVLILLVIFSIGIFAYAMFPRKTKNFLAEWIPAWKKRYVVCHVRYPTGQSDAWKVVPNQQGLTQVGKYSYNLSDTYAIMRYNNRLHFLLDESDTIPRTMKERTKEDIIFQAAEIQTALNNTVMDYLFSRKKELLIMGLFGLGILCLIALVYVGYEIFSMKEAIAAQAHSIIEVQP